MDERSTIPEEDAASTLPEEPTETTVPVDEAQPSSAEQVESSPEDQPPAEPPKKENILSKHKKTILRIGLGILGFIGIGAVVWDNLKKKRISRHRLYI